mgnify:CR=1 FL=1
MSMFGFFKKKSPLEKLQLEYKTLLSEAHKLSKIDRKRSDQKMAEADEILKKMDQLSEKRAD